MVRTGKRIVESWTLSLAAFIGVAAWWAAHILPTAGWWFDVRSVIISDSYAGIPAVMLVDREVHRPFRADWTATVRRLADDGHSVRVCAASGTDNYAPDAILPEPLTLAWWASPECADLPPGRYYVETTWRLEPPDAVGDRHVISRSNLFTVH